MLSTTLMYDSISRWKSSRWKCRRWTLPMLLAYALCGPAAAQTDEGKQSPDGPGIMIRADHIEGQGVPQAESITPLQLFPYLLLDESSLFFSDVRFYSTNEALFGGNAGLGYRYYSASLDRVFGISGWYDGDNTRELYFQQAGLSLESYAWLLDLRANLYLPVGETEQQQSLLMVPGSVRFSGDGLLYDLHRSTYVQMKGIDFELGVPIPGEFAEQHGIRVYGGGYAFEDDRNLQISGYSARVQANLFAGLDAQVQVTHDDYFQTRAFAGMSWTFGRLHRSELKRSTALNRIGEHVTRNYTVLAPLHEQYEHQRAVDPATGLPYTFAHVSSAAATSGNGTVESPLNTLSTAQGGVAASADIIFVHANTVINGAETIALQPGQRMLGDGGGLTHYILVPEFGYLPLPQGSASGALPTINGSLGDAVALASQSELRGFVINGSGGSGIVGSGVQNALVGNVAINGAAADGLRLIDSSGLLSISNLAVNGAGGSGIALQGGSGIVDLVGATSLAGAGGAALSIKDLAAGGVVSMDNISIANRQNRGVEIDNSAGLVQVAGTATIANEAGSQDSAFDMRNSSGNLEVNRLDVTGAVGAAGVNLESNTGKTTLGTLNISSQGATGLRAHSGGTVVLNQAVNDKVDVVHGGTITAVGGRAVDVENTKLDLNFTAVNSSNADRGVSLVNTTGQFVVLGDGSTIGSGGTISGADTAFYLENTGLTAFQFMTLDANGVGVQANNVAELVILGTQISNSASYGVDALNVAKLRMATSFLTGNGNSNLRAQFDKVGSYAYDFGNNGMISATADNVVIGALAGAAGSTMNLTITGSGFQNTLAGTTGVKVDWNGTLSTGIDNVTFLTDGGGNTGLAIHNVAPAAPSTIRLLNSGFHSSAAGDTAVRLSTVGASQVTIDSNTTEFKAAQGTGYRMTLGSSSNVNLSNNLIFDAVDGTTGILFDAIAGPSNVTFGKNHIELKNTGALLDQGIIFSSVSGTIQLTSTADNVVKNTDTPFFIPVGKSTGTVLINGVAVP